MAILTFETLSFAKKERQIEVTLLKLFKTSIPQEEIETIALFELRDSHTLSFNHQDQEKIETKFFFLLTKYFDHLTNKLTGNKATYIHKNSGIPLIGNVAFGIVHRGSSIIEIKPVTSCNLDCIYCSISEGLFSTKNDFVVEKDYLIGELKKVLDFVDEEIEIHIGVQGEPFLYADMENLISDLQAMKKVHTISIDTNGTLLTKEKIDSLAENKKLQLNLSLDALDEETAKKMAGAKSYNIKHVKEIIAYATKKLNVIVAPVLTEGYNEQEMEKIINWIKTLHPQPKLGIQNFLHYKTGRTPSREIPWEKFYALLETWEKKYDLKLHWRKEDFKVREVRDLPKPFKVGDVVKAVIKCVDRFPGSVIAVTQDRTISVPHCEFKKDKKIKIQIMRDKHNIFAGKPT